MTKLTNWNGRPKVQNARIEPYEKELSPNAIFIPRGMGRSYGDASLQTTVLDATSIREILHLEGDLLEVSAGFSVGEILNFSVPKGYILPVIPGTQHVSVGGMIAADVHGKNHVQNGTIGRWIQSLKIQLPNGQIETCGEEINALLFKTTIGGLGLTGVIISAKIKLIPLNNAHFEQKTQVYASVNALFEALEKSDAPYKTGWFDFFQKDHCLLIENYPIIDSENLSSFTLKKPKFTVPFASFPWIQSFGMKLYNKRYFSATKRQKGPVILDDVLFPLDRIGAWNKLYGKRGFYQLQWCWSASQNEEKLARIIKAIETSKFTPVLAVVKQHGELESPGILSFPKPGFSFAFDFIYKNGLDEFIRLLHTIIAEEGGRVYLVKDSLLESKNFDKMYPESGEFKSSIAPFNQERIASLLSKRINLTSMNRRFLIVGANSDIAQACIPLFEAKGISLILAAHKPEDIQSDKHEVITLDVTQTDAAIATISTLDINGIIYAAGLLPDNEKSLFGPDADRVMAVNYTSAVRIIGSIAEKFKAQKSGVIVGISSVGAARGKSSNVVYGSAKSGFDHYLSGLRQFLHPHGVRVITIRPGFVATKMTSGMDLPTKLTASKEQVARTIVKHALKGKRNVVYVKPIWRLITTIINRVPEPIFKRKQL